MRPYLELLKSLQEQREHLGQGTEASVAAMVVKMTSKLPQKSRKPLITMLEMVLNGQELEDMEHWDLGKRISRIEKRNANFCSGPYNPHDSRTIPPRDP